MDKIILANQTPIIKGEEAALFDLGDGIACLEFRSKGNSISTPVVAFLLDTLEKHMKNFDGLVIGNQGKHYSVGANLVSFRKTIDEKDFELFLFRMNRFQQMAQTVKEYNKPIVAAPFGNVLGAGLELVLHCHKRVAHSGVRMGLVEAGVGLLPSGGGVKETTLGIYEKPESEQLDALVKGFEKLICKKKSKNAMEARDLNYLSKDDVIIEDVSDILNGAKHACLQMGIRPKTQEKCIKLAGEVGYNLLNKHMEKLLEEDKISPYDIVIGKAIAEILTGGKGEPIYTTENQLFEAERIRFVELTKDKRTYERISYLLENGQLLAN